MISGIALIGCFAALGRSSAAAPPSVESVLAPLEHQRMALLSKESWTLEFWIESNVHVPGSYAYRQIEVTDRRRGKEYRVTTRFSGSIVPNVNLPDRATDYSFVKGIARDRSEHE